MTSSTGPRLTDLEQRYPFAPRSRRFFESVSVEEGLASRDVLAQTELRLLGALGRADYQPHISEHIEFLSFFGAALVASQDTVLALKFARKEGEKARERFVEEAPESKSLVAAECFGIHLELRAAGDRPRYVAPVEAYLGLVSKYGLVREPRWKLVRQDLERGEVSLGDNLLNDLFGSCAEAAVSEGVKGLRRGPLPKQLLGVRDAVMRYVPVQKQRTGKGYLYVEDLIKRPVTDGRHRLVWLVLAPYLVNVKKVPDEEAVEKIMAFVAAGGESRAIRRFVEYNVKRARRNGLLPPTYSTLKEEHPDIHWLLPKEVVASEEAKVKAARPK